MDDVRGYCPMGCGETLFLGRGGYVTCSLLGCPNPSAVNEILHDRETEHVVVFSESGFNVQHPLRERVNNELLDCTLHDDLSRQAGPPVKPGTYRVYHVDGGGWHYEEIKA